MKKFKFKLQAVHKVRQLRQEKEQLILAQIQSEVIKTEERIREIEEMRYEAIRQYTNRLGRGKKINPLELEVNSKHISSLDRLRREAERELSEKKKDFSKQAENVAVASQQVQITERLREKHQTRHRLELVRQEQNAIDELVSAKYARQMTKLR